MEPSIAIFIVWWLVCEHPPTSLNAQTSCGRRICTYQIRFIALRTPTHIFCVRPVSTQRFHTNSTASLDAQSFPILAEGAIALSVTLSGGALFAS